MTTGFIYCIINSCYQDLCKIGMTKRTPDHRLREANSNSTWQPSPFVLAFAMKVDDAKVAERALHKLLNAKRYSANREFFQISPEDLKKHFDNIGGEYWEAKSDIKNVPNKNRLRKPLPKKSKNPDACRDMSKCFTHGQRIRHTIRSVNSTWEGTYDATKNEVVCEGIGYGSLSAFGGAHYKEKRNDRREKTNG